MMAELVTSGGQIVTDPTTGEPVTTGASYSQLLKSGLGAWLTPYQHDSYSDFSGNGNDGTAVGVTQFEDGPHGRCLRLQKNGHVQCGDVYFPAAGDELTVAAHVSHDDPANGVPFGQSSGFGSGYYVRYGTNIANGYLGTYDTGNISDDLYRNDWKSLSMRYSPLSGLTIDLDDLRGTDSSGSVTDGGDQFFIGARGGSVEFGGRIQSVVVSDRRWSDGEWDAFRAGPEPTVTNVQITRTGDTLTATANVESYNNGPATLTYLWQRVSDLATVQEGASASYTPAEAGTYRVWVMATNNGRVSEPVASADFVYAGPQASGRRLQSRPGSHAPFAASPSPFASSPSPVAR